MGYYPCKNTKNTFWRHFFLEIVNMCGEGKSFNWNLRKKVTEKERGGAQIGAKIPDSGTLYFFSRYVAELEKSIVSVERVREYQSTPQEAAFYVSEIDPQEPSWPQRGEIIFQDYATRYRDGMDLVLRGVSFQIKVGLLSFYPISISNRIYYDTLLARHCLFETSKRKRLGQKLIYSLLHTVWLIQGILNQMERKAFFPPTPCLWSKNKLAIPNRSIFKVWGK